MAVWKGRKVSQTVGVVVECPGSVSDPDVKNEGRERI